MIPKDTAPNSSDKRSEDPEKVRVFQEFIANIGANEPKITTITSLGEILKVMVKMIKNPEHLAQLNAAINTRFGKSITIVPWSVQDPWFAFLAFRWEENGKVQEYSLWMDSKNKLVKKNWFSPDEYKTVWTYSLGEHPLSPLWLQK